MTILTRKVNVGLNVLFESSLKFKIDGLMDRFASNATYRKLF